MKKNGNGFATKDDLKKLEKKVDLGFARVDKKLGSIDIRLGVFKLSWDNWKQDAFTEFDSRWVNKIDPILAEIEKHREKEVVWAEQNRRMEKKLDRFGERLGKVDQRMNQFGERFDKVDQRMNQFGERFDKVDQRMNQFGEKLETVAKKVGA